ncbi:MAG: triple tyrosine motif-containing protein [Halioglobus sp.]
MAQPTITRIFKDSTGFLWIGTQHGLYRFDGTDVRKFDSSKKGKNYISHSDIRGISETISGDLLVATFGGGLLKLEKKDDGFELLEIAGNSSGLELIDLHRLTGNHHLATSKSGILSIDLDTRSDSKWIKAELTELKIDDIVDVVAIDPQRALLASKTDLVTLNFSHRSIRRLDVEISESDITSLALANGNSIFLGTSNGSIHELDIASETLVRSIDLSGDDVSRITDILTIEGTLWIGTDGGLIVSSIDTKTTKHFSQKNSKLSHDYITRIFPGNGFLLIGTYQGLDQIRPNSISNYNHRNSEIYNDVLAFSEDSKSDVWIGTYNGIFRFQEETGKHLHLVTGDGSSLPDNRIMALASHGDSIFIGLQQHGLYKLDLRNNSLASLSNPTTSDLAVTKILVTTDGTIWVSSYNKGVFILDNADLIAIDSGKELSFTQVFETLDGEIFAGSERQLYQYSRSSRSFRDTELEFPIEASSPLFLSINESRDGNLLIGTKDHGIFIWKGSDRDQGLSQVHRFTDHIDLTATTVYGILFDDQHNVWCSTQQGIVVLEPDGKQKFRLTPQDGLQADDYNFGAYFRDSSGDMYFGGVNGYNKLTPSLVEFVNQPSPTIISQIEIGNRRKISYYELSTVETLQLSPDSNSLSIRVNLLDFADPASNQYSHILEGFDQSWIDDGTDNTINYTNLAPGEYVFRAKAANSAGIWNEEGVSLKIRVLPPWWFTWWAGCLYVALALALIWGVMRVYRSHLLKEEALRFAVEMQDSADRAQDDLQDSQEFHNELIRAVHKHNLDTLELIGRCLESSDKGQANPRIRGHLKAMELLEGCYYFQGGMLMANLSTYVDSLTNHLLQSTPVDPVTITTINLTTSELLPARIASPAAVILYELFENALLHAFSTDSAANFIEFRADINHLSHSERTLILSVADDGMGWSPDSLAPSSQSMGLKIVDALAQSLGGAINVTHDNGSQISLELPLTD